MAWCGGGLDASQWALPGLLALCVAAGSASAAPPPTQPRATAMVQTESGSESETETEEDDLQQRLTEREDKRRPLDPISIDIAGRPLIVGGEVELEAAKSWPHANAAPPARDDRSLLELGVETEAFYSFGPPLSLFAQVRLAMEEDMGVGDCMEGDCTESSGRYLERGEMWLYSQDIAGSGIDLDVGRLDFEDDRRWWWDDELDAVRIAYETGSLEVALAFARELGPDRSDRDFIDPEHDHVQRLIAEASWDWAPNHSLQLFSLRQHDRSRTDAPGQILSKEREDESDAQLTWLGARAIGVVDAHRWGLVGYWLDWAQVRGEERLVEYDALTPLQSEVAAVLQRKVRGRALDAGINWLLPLAGEPRLFAGFASGSGGADDGSDVDRSFRQTGLQGNEAGFGGVQRYPHYGVLLDPELSNLHVHTLGAGLSLLRSSSLDVVYHRYRLEHPAESLRDARLELELDATNRDLGHAFDVVLALEEWERFECVGVVSGFRSGPAVAAGEGTWSYGAFLAMRIVF